MGISKAMMEKLMLSKSLLNKETNQTTFLQLDMKCNVFKAHIIVC